MWPIPSPGDLPDPGIEPLSPEVQVDSLQAELPGKPIIQDTLSQNFTTVVIKKTSLKAFRDKNSKPNYHLISQQQCLASEDTGEVPSKF